MKKIFFLLLITFGISSFSQTKKWTLEECVTYALQNNISLKLSALDIQSSTIEKNSAYGNFLPRVNADASHAWNIGLNQNITTGLLENQTTQFTSAGLNANVVIYNGLQNQNRLRRSNMAIIASQYQLSKMKDDISLNVANAFLQILFNKENIKVLTEQLENDKKQQIRTQELINAGTIPRGDLNDINATIASDNQRIVTAQNQFMISKLSLAQLLQLKDFQTFDIEDENYPVTVSEVMFQSPEAIFNKAKENRNEIKIAKVNLDIAQKDIEIAKGDYQPTVNGFYSFNTRVSYADQFVGLEPNTANPTSPVGFLPSTGESVLQPNFSPVLGKPDAFFDQLKNNKGQNFGLQLQIPIFNGLTVRNNVERSKVALERNKIALSQTELDLERSVYTAFADANGAFKTFEASMATLDARELAFGYAKERFAVGMMNTFDYNQAQLLYATAKSDALRAKYDYIFRTKIVEFYFGIPIIKK
jgi:outer membrane protein